jgi:hypothetical protein
MDERSSPWQEYIGPLAGFLDMTHAKAWTVVAVALVATACGGGHVEPVPPESQAGLSGLWRLNEDLSEDLSQTARDGRGGPGGASPSGGGGRGMGGRRGGRRGGPGGAGDPAQIRVAMRALQPAQRIDLELADSTVILRFNRQAPLSLSLDGEKVEIEIGPESKMKAKAEWKGGTLRTKREYDRITITETYALVSGTDRMEVVVESGLGGRKLELRRIYDRVGN